jgi:alginate O-acetyltransferase complex protein AlgI
VGFFAAAANELAAMTIPVPELTLPLGISFFTFTQIAFLVDPPAGLARRPRACLVVSFD